MNDIEYILKAFHFALTAELYKVQLKNRKTEEGFWVEYTPTSLIKSAKFLRYKNSQGFDIYARPKGYQYILLDDLKREVLQELASLQPCMLIETSPRNYQAWLTLPELPSDREAAKLACKELAVRFKADLASAEPDHVGRLPGFTNRKEKYRQSNGHYPMVVLRRAAKRLSTFYPCGGAVLEERKLKETSITQSHQCNVSGYSQSEQDFGIACGLIRRGQTDEQIISYLLKVSPNLQQRKGRHVYRYLQRTVTNARKQF